MLLRLSGYEVPLLDELFEGVASAIATMSASCRIDLVNLLPTVATFRPVDIAPSWPPSSS